MILDNDNSDEFLQESLFRRHNLHGLSSSELIPFICMYVWEQFALHEQEIHTCVYSTTNTISYRLNLEVNNVSRQSDRL